MLDQVYGKETIEPRLRLFEQVRRNRGSSIQILSNHIPPTPQSDLDAAAKYLPDRKTLENTNDINEYMFSFDVVKEYVAVLA